MTEPQRRPTVGTIRVCILALDLIALGLAATASLGCTFFKVNFWNEPRRKYEDFCDDDRDPPRASIETQTIGLWRKEELDGCTSADPPDFHERPEEKSCSFWDDFQKDFDTAWKLARAMALLTLVLGGLLLLRVRIWFWNKKVTPFIHLPLVVFSILAIVGKSSSIADEYTYAMIHGTWEAFRVESTEPGNNYYLFIVA